MQFPDRSHGFFIAHDAGRPVLLGTADGGATWEQRWPALAPQMTAPLQLFTATSAIAGGAFTDSGAILETSDGGRTWSAIGHLPADRITDLRFTSRRQGQAITESYAPGSDRYLLYATHDGGHNWERLGPARADRLTGTGTDPGLRVPALSCRLQQIAPADAGAAWAVGSQCLPGAQSWTLLRTTDGGQHWTPFALANLDPFHVTALDSQTAWLTDGRGHVYTTTDGGAHWQQAY